MYLKSTDLDIHEILVAVCLWKVKLDYKFKLRIDLSFNLIPKQIFGPSIICIPKQVLGQI